MYIYTVTQWMTPDSKQHYSVCFLVCGGYLNLSFIFNEDIQYTDIGRYFARFWMFLSADGKNYPVGGLPCR